MQLLIGLLFLVITIGYGFLQFGTRLLGTRYPLQTVLLLGSGALGIGYAILVLAPRAAPSLPGIVTGVIAAALGAVLGILGLAKLLFLPADRLRPMNSLERSLTRFPSTAQAFDLITEDGVRIRALGMQADPRRKAAVIVCHGGGRNKNVYVYVATCGLLFEDYDVFTFDSRGHLESDGKWTGDGRSKYDLKAVVDHVRAEGYEWLGVVGRSFGAWTAIMEAAEYRNVDSIVALAPPPTDMREVALTRALFSWGYSPLALPLRALVTILRALRIGHYTEHPSLMDHVGRVAPIPLLIVCNEYDRVIGVSADRFRELYDRAGEPKRFEVLRGSGHVYDWPNTFHAWMLIRDWLAQTLRSSMPS